MLTIDERLGLLVAPSQVRLQPSTQDGYAWSVTKSKESLLQTSLSNGTVGLYQAIREELGRSLEAVSPRILRQGGEEHGTQPDSVSGSSNLFSTAEPRDVSATTSALGWGYGERLVHCNNPPTRMREPRSSSAA